MTALTESAVWHALPARMPGMVPSVVALRFPGAALPEITRALEEMVAAGTAVRRTRRGHDVYYRGVAPAAAATQPEETPLWT